MRTLAVIPARGGSKRVPGKNLADVGGKSLLVRAIESAAPCTSVVVSSDDGEIRTAAAERLIAGLGREHQTPWMAHVRSAAASSDAAQIEDTIAEVLAELPCEDCLIDEPDAIVLLQPTSPFRTAAHVAEALRVLRETGCDSVVSVTRLHSLDAAFHGWTEDGRYRPIDARASRPRSQDLASLCYENGAVYAFTRKHWNATRNRMGGDMRALVMDEHDATEIDTPKHLEQARVIAAGRAALGLP